MGNWMVNDVCCYLDGTVSRQGGVTRGGGPTGDATPGLDMPRPPASTDAGGGIETREGARRLAFGGQGWEPCLLLGLGEHPAIRR